MTVTQTRTIEAKDLKPGQTLVMEVRVLGSPLDVPREITKVIGPDEDNLFMLEFVEPKYDGEAHYYMGASRVEVIKK